MYFGVFSHRSSRMLASYESRDEAVAAVRKVLVAEPDSASFLAVMEYDDRGRCLDIWSGEQLHDLVGALCE